MVNVHGAKRFSEIFPGIVGEHRDDYYFRFEWINRMLVESDSANPVWHATVNNIAVAVRPESAHNHRRALLEKPSVPCVIDLDDGHEHARIWLISATIVARSGSGDTVIDNRPEWQHTLALWREYYGNGNFTRLGLMHFRYDTGSGGGIRYGANVEYVGRVSPASVAATGMKFYIARRIVRSTIRSLDEAGNQLPADRSAGMYHHGDNDTTAGQSGLLTSNGELFDHDMAGSVMKNNTNKTHDSHFVDINFEICLAIGEPPRCHGTIQAPICTDPWPRINSLFLAVCDIIPWRANYIARVTQAHTVTNLPLEISLVGTLG